MISLISILILIINLVLLKVDDYKKIVTDYNERLESLTNLIDNNNEKKYLIDGSHIYKMYTKNNEVTIIINT